MLAILHIESKANFLLCSKNFIVLLVPLLAVVHLFVNMLLSIFVTTTLMWLIFIAMTTPVVIILMLDQYDLPIVPQLCVL